MPHCWTWTLTFSNTVPYIKYTVTLFKFCTVVESWTKNKGCILVNLQHSGVWKHRKKSTGLISLRNKNKFCCKFIVTIRVKQSLFYAPQLPLPDTYSNLFISYSEDLLLIMSTIQNIEMLIMNTWLMYMYGVILFYNLIKV